MRPRCSSRASAPTRSSAPSNFPSSTIRPPRNARLPARPSSRSTGRSHRSFICGVVAITRAAGGRLALGGKGEPVEWAVEMRRFDENATLDHLADRGKIDARLADALARAVATAHARRAGGRRRAVDRGARRLYPTERCGIPRDAGTCFDAAADAELTDGEPRLPRPAAPPAARARHSRVSYAAATATSISATSR